MKSKHGGNAMKHKSIFFGMVFSAVTLLSVSGLVFAANTTDTISIPTNTSLEERTCIAPGGKTDSQLEFWEVNEFESWMEQEREYYQQLADSSDKSFWYQKEDEAYVCREWTQADVDTLYATWKDQLDLMRQGYQFTKVISLPNEGLLAGGFEP